MTTTVGGEAAKAILSECEGGCHGGCKGGSGGIGGITAVDFCWWYGGGRSSGNRNGCEIVEFLQICCCSSGRLADVTEA